MTPIFYSFSLFPDVT